MVPKKATRLNFEQDDGHRRKADREVDKGFVPAGITAAGNVSYLV
jgi:hypothetical protein